MSEWLSPRAQTRLVGEDAEKMQPLYFVGEEQALQKEGIASVKTLKWSKYKLGQPLLKSTWRFLKN
jgi:hypothetical protein